MNHLECSNGWSALRLSCCLAVTNGWSWGNEGHRMVAIIASEELSGPAARNVRALLPKLPRRYNWIISASALFFARNRSINSAIKEPDLVRWR